MEYHALHRCCHETEQSSQTLITRYYLTVRATSPRGIVQHLDAILSAQSPPPSPFSSRFNQETLSNETSNHGPAPGGITRNPTILNRVGLASRSSSLLAARALETPPPS